MATALESEHCPLSGAPTSASSRADSEAVTTSPIDTARPLLPQTLVVPGPGRPSGGYHWASGFAPDFLGGGIGMWVGGGKFSWRNYSYFSH